MLYTCDIILHVLQSNVVSLDSLAAVLVSSRNAPPRAFLLSSGEVMLGT